MNRMSRVATARPGGLRSTMACRCMIPTVQSTRCPRRAAREPLLSTYAEGSGGTVEKTRSELAAEQRLAPWAEPLDPEAKLRQPLLSGFPQNKCLLSATGTCPPNWIKQHTLGLRHVMQSVHPLTPAVASVNYNRQAANASAVSRGDSDLPTCTPASPGHRTPVTRRRHRRM
jgi:hypothetical protein